MAIFSCYMSNNLVKMMFDGVIHCVGCVLSDEVKFPSRSVARAEVLRDQLKLWLVWDSQSNQILSCASSSNIKYLFFIHRTDLRILPLC